MRKYFSTLHILTLALLVQIPFVAYSQDSGKYPNNGFHG